MRLQVWILLVGVLSIFPIIIVSISFAIVSNLGFPWGQYITISWIVFGGAIGFFAAATKMVLLLLVAMGFVGLIVLGEVASLIFSFVLMGSGVLDTPSLTTLIIFDVFLLPIILLHVYLCLLKFRLYRRLTVVSISPEYVDFDENEPTEPRVRKVSSVASAMKYYNAKNEKKPIPEQPVALEKGIFADE